MKQNGTYTEEVKRLFHPRFKIAVIQIIQLRQLSGQRHNFSTTHFASNSMLPACLLGMIISLKLHLNE